MKLKLKTALEYPLKDVTTKGAYSIDVLILFMGDLYVGYYNFTNCEWRYQDESCNEEITFVFKREHEFEWTNLPNPINQK